MPAYQDYTARGKISEAILAVSSCRVAVTETVQSNSTALPGPGSWGCESKTGQQQSKYVAALQTNADGEIRVLITGVNTTANGMAIIMKPYSDATAASPITGSSSAGSAIATWSCGPDPANSNDITRFLPGTCRAAISSSGGHAAGT
jgi:type IV pilus assembly protein PilA